MKQNDFRKLVVKYFYLDHLKTEEIARILGLTSSIISRIIYDDASNNFELLKKVKEEQYG